MPFTFCNTPATQKIFKLKKKIKAVCGGTSASKTISILVWLIDYAQSSSNKTIDVMSESYPHLEGGAIKDFKAIMLDREYWNDDLWNETKHIYKFETGSIIKFISIDTPGKAHGPRRDVLFINEANNIEYTIYDQLAVRTKEHIWLDWNPSREFWYYTDIKDKVDHDFITLTYKDCLDVLDPSIIAYIEGKKENKNWWQVYGLGQLGEVEGKIYTDWNIIDEIPFEARLERYGLDFGYSNDPTTIIAIYYYNGGYILDEILYRKGMLNNEIANFIKNQKPAMVVADSAEPKSIEDIRQYGVNITGAKKSKQYGGGLMTYLQWSINQVQEQRISVTKSSINLIKEYRNYLWKTDKDGKILNQPEGGYDHCLDATRYALISLVPVIRAEEYRNTLRINYDTRKKENRAR